LGFGLGLVGIWLVTRGKTDHIHSSRISIILTLAAGLDFGSFLVLITRIDTQEIYIPLASAKIAVLITEFIMIKLTNQSVPRIALMKLYPIMGTHMPIALVSGVLDAGGNVFYLVANTFTRLDVVAVLSSFYLSGRHCPVIFFLLEGQSPGKSMVRGIRLHPGYYPDFNLMPNKLFAVSIIAQTYILLPQKP